MMKKTKSKSRQNMMKKDKEIQCKKKKKMMMKECSTYKNDLDQK